MEYSKGHILGFVRGWVFVGYLCIINGRITSRNVNGLNQRCVIAISNNNTLKIFYWT